MNLKNIVIISLSAATLIACNSGSNGEIASSVANVIPTSPIVSAVNGLNKIESGVQANGKSCSSDEQVAVDSATQLMWLRDLSPESYSIEIAYQKTIAGDYCGYTNWRVPFKDEITVLARNLGMKALMGFENFFNSSGFNNVDPTWYWIYYPDTRQLGAYFMDAGYGLIITGRELSSAHVWPVRNILLDGFKIGTQANAAACQPGEETVIDSVNNLMWVRKPVWTSGHAWNKPDIPSSYCNYTDWRLPTKDELTGLVEHAKNLGATPPYTNWFNSHGFSNILPQYYWTSTSAELKDDEEYTPYAWYVELGTGKEGKAIKTGDYNVWVVRSIK